MSLMKLAPESVRLRRIARAYAAGEMTEAEYRAARREVIDRFPSAPVQDDDTRRRPGDEPTLRNGAARASAVAEEAPGVAAGSRRWLWLLALGLVLAAAAAVPRALAAAQPLAAGQPGVEVPPVRERTPDPTSSPRLPVHDVHVVWADAADLMPDGVLEALERRADLALDEVRRRNRPGAHGFTDSELTEIARFLDVLGVHRGDGGLDAADARDLSALIREQKQRRGISVAQLEEVAAAVEAEVRAQGYFLAVAYLPAQHITDGVARIDVLPGVLGDVVVEGGNPAPVAGTFASLLGQPLELDAVSARLQTLNALPGVTAQASFGPGDEVGASRLHLDLLEQRGWLASVTADNDGDDATGDQRIGLTGTWLNPRHAGDRLTAGLLATVNPANQTYGYVDYDTPIAGAYRLSVRVGNNDFHHPDPVRLDGDGWFVDVAARRSLTYSRERGLTLVLGGARQELDWDAGVDQSITLLGVGLAGHRVLERPRLAADAALGLSVGHVGGDRFIGQDDDFWLLELDSEAWMPVSLPGLDSDPKLVLRLAGQWSDSLLPATRRFALGGAHHARAFDRGLFLADRGLLLGLEVRAPVHVGELVAFTDFAYGDGRADDAETWARLGDIGLGWEAELSPNLSSRLFWAMPLTAAGTGGIDDDGGRLYWSIRYDH